WRRLTAAWCHRRPRPAESPGPARSIPPRVLWRRPPPPTHPAPPLVLSGSSQARGMTGKSRSERQSQKQEEARPAIGVAPVRMRFALDDQEQQPRYSLSSSSDSIEGHVYCTRHAPFLAPVSADSKNN